MSKTIKRTIIVSSTIALLLLFLVGNNVFAILSVESIQQGI